MSVGAMAMMWPEWWEDRFFVLINTAKTLKDQGHPEAAIVTAQTACEVCTEIFLEAGFRNQDIAYLKGPINDLLTNTTTSATQGYGGYTKPSAMTK